MTALQLKEWRRKAGMTQLELAKHLGLALNTISRYEQGKRTIGRFVPLALAVLKKRLARLASQ